MNGRGCKKVAGTGHVGYALEGIIDDDREVIGHGAVLAAQDNVSGTDGQPLGVQRDVAAFAGGAGTDFPEGKPADCSGAAQEIDRPANVEPEGVGVCHIGRVAATAGAGIGRSALGTFLRCTGGGLNLLTRTGARIDKASGMKRADHLLMHCCAL